MLELNAFSHILGKGHLDLHVHEPDRGIKDSVEMHLEVVSDLQDDKLSRCWRSSLSCISAQTNHFYFLRIVPQPWSEGVVAVEN